MPDAAKIELTESQREELEHRAGSRTIAQRAVERAKIIVRLALGKAGNQVAKELGIARQTVGRWGRRFQERGTEGLEDAPRSGRPRSIGEEKIQQIVHKTTQETPTDSTHWSTRSLGTVMHVSASSISRIWRAHKLKPHRVRTFKLSNDRLFAEKLEDVVELYLHPPADSVVWSADEQCHLQALTRTQPSLPCAPGHCSTETHDYGKHGTTTLFAAMNMGSGEVVYTFHAQHRHEEWIPFLAMIEEATPPDKQIHLIIDNYSAHKHAEVGLWLKEHPRFHIHYVPTSGSWLNQVERLFSELVQKCLRYRSARNTAELEQAIAQYLDRRNENPRPFRWKANVLEILRKVQRAWAVLQDRYGAKKPSAALASIEHRLAAEESVARVTCATGAAAAVT